ncbi:MAG: cytochrome c biogenesis protein CcdA [Deltaproteobacteria bacterium]|nr:MAG: cytochrome c biogenesis protein CcdA [Deltaproteobacteria bacterium]
MKVPLLLAFLAGIGSFFSPCVLPLLPVYLSAITGMRPGGGGGKVFMSALFFVGGFSAVFVLLGVSLSGFGQVLLLRRPLFQVIGGGVILLFALQLLGIPLLPFLYKERRADLVISTPFIGPFLTGAAYAFGWSPCVGPILGAILTYTATTQDPRGGGLLLGAYSLGMSLPFLGVALFWGRILEVLMRIRKVTRYATLGTSLLLGGVGLWLIYGGVRGL